MRNAALISNGTWQSFRNKLLLPIFAKLPFEAGMTSDRILLALTMAMSAFGLAMVYSASYIFSQERFDDGLYYFRRHAVFLTMGVCLLAFFRYLDYRWLKRVALPVFFACIAMMLMTLIPGLGHRAGGAARWLDLGPFTVQPVEFAKLSLILYMASKLCNEKQNWDKISTGFLFHLWPVALMAAACMAQPDFGSMMLVCVVTFIMLFLAGVRKRFLAGSLLAVVPLLAAVMIAAPYRRARLLTYLDPWADPQGAGFQIIQSFVAFYRGGLFGVGLGNGKSKIFYLPEAHNDFILSVIGEELGFLGIVCIVTAFILLIYRMIRTSAKCPDRFGALLAGGLGILLGLEVFWHSSVVLGLVPNKGMNLPFISSGGSSILCALALVGVILNISAQSKQESILR